MPILHYLFRIVSTTWRWFRGIFRSNVHGQARWMNRFEIRRFLSPKQKGLFFSEKHRLSPSESFKNLCLVAPTGSGKTTRFVIPNLLKLKGSAVVTDPSGEIFKKTSGHLESRGFRIQVLQPTNLQQSQQFNPLARFRTSQELKKLATILAENNTGSDEFWRVSATNILHVCLSAIVGCGDEEVIHLGNVRWLLNHLGLEMDSVKKFMCKNLDDVMFAEYKAFLAQDPKVAANILSTARAALDLWSDSDIVQVTSANTIDLESIRKELTVIYLIVPEDKIRYFSLILNLFYSACFERCLKKDHENSLSVFFFLDEFGNLGRLNNFAAIATTLRKRNCSISIILQDLAQLKALYGHNDATSIFSGGMNNKLFFSGLDLDTSTYLEKMLGTNTAYDVVYGDFSEKARTVAKPLLGANEIRMLPERKAILISGRQLPIKIKMMPYFKSTKLSALTKKSPAQICADVADGKIRYLEFDECQTTISKNERPPIKATTI